MRIVFDVSPLSHALLGIGRYLRGSLAGLAEAAGDEHEIVPFAPTSPQGLKAIPAGAGRHPGRGAPPLPALRARLAAGLEPEPLAAGRTLPRAVRRAPLLGLDVPAAAERRARDHGARPRARALPGVGARAHAADAHGEVPRTCAQLRRRVRELGLHRPRGHRADGRARRARTRGLPRRRSALPPGRRAGRSGRAVPAQRGDVRAAEEPRRPRLRLRLLGGTTSGSRSSGPPAGESSRASTIPAIVRLGFVDDEELARLYRGASAFVYPSRFEGFGIPIVEAMASGVPVVASAHESMDEASGDVALRADPESAEAFAEAIGRALDDPRRRRASAGSRTPRASGGSRPGAPSSAATRRCVMRVGIDLSPLDQTAAGTARYIAALAGSTALDLVRRRARGAAARHGVPRRRLVPARAAARAQRARSTCSTARPSGSSPAAGMPARRDGSRPRRVAPPGDLQPVDAAVQPPVCLSRGAGGKARDRGLRAHEARARRAARRAGGEDPRRSRTGSASAFSPEGPAETATTCSRSARSSRARTWRASPRPRGGSGVELASSARRAGATWSWAPACAGSAGSRTTSSPGCTAARAASPTRLSTRASASRSSRRWPAERPS